MKKLILILIVLIMSTVAYGQGIAMPSNSSAVTDNAVSTLSNPAWLGFRSGAEAFLLHSYDDATASGDLGILVKLGTIGFAGEFVDNEIELYNRYTLAKGFRMAEGLYSGLSYTWYRAVDREGSWNIGMGFRPLPFVSAGITAYDVNEPNWNGTDIRTSYDLALALRPFGHQLTLSGDVLLTKSSTHDYGDELDPRIRLELLPVDGIRITGEYHTDSEFLGVGLSLAFDNLALGHFTRMDDGGNTVNSVSYAQLSSSRHLNIFSPPKRIVEITIGGEILESEPRYSFFRERGKTLWQLRQEIIHYANDPKVDGLLITFETPEYGLAQAQQIRRALEEFKLTGKKLIAYAENYTQTSYYVASVCDEVYLMPTGYLDVKGLAFVMGYWKKTLDKLGIEVQVARAREYKTATNMLTYEDTPEPEAEMLNWLLDDIYDQLCTRIGEGRGWVLEEVKEKINVGAYNCRRALDEGLVDGLTYYDQITRRLENDDYSPVGEDRYWRSPEYTVDWPDIRLPKVAVIYAEGPIFSGESQGDFWGTDYMGSKTISEAIRHAREDRSIDAIILRVDSPGGSATASDVIYHEVRRTVTDEKNRKPLIVSMGNVAGSGGYFIACGADTIVAEEGTITGSIGVLGLKVILAGLYEKIYYNTHTFKRGEHADAWRTTRPFTEEEMEMLQETIDQYYDDFLERVAEARGMSKEEIDEVAEGRVWTGNQALEKGLVDLIGGMDVAMSIVRGRLGVEESAPLKLDFYPKPKPFFAGLYSDVLSSNSRTLPDVLIEAVEPLALMLEFYDGEPLMLMPHKVELK